MPYDNIDDLPESVRNNLPKHAQEIFKEAFNNAWDEYKQPKDRKDDASRQETSLRLHGQRLNKHIIKIILEIGEKIVID